MEVGKKREVERDPDRPGGGFIHVCLKLRLLMCLTSSASVSRRTKSQNKECGRLRTAKELISLKVFWANNKIYIKRGPLLKTQSSSQKTTQK